MKGLRVQDTLNFNGNGHKAGIIVDDVLIGLDQHKLDSVDGLIKLMQMLDGAECIITLVRKGELKKVTVTSGSLGLSLVPVDIENTFYNVNPDDEAFKNHFDTVDDQFNLQKNLEKIIVTTTPEVDGHKVVKNLGVIGAECAFGMNILKDLFASVRDVTGGRSGAIQSTLRDAREASLADLKKEANQKGANAVIGVNLDYSEFSGGGKSMLFVAVTGTAVLIEPTES
ncbi:YbjQ family protein [Terasakiispira papahanaumokuakeensis]|uniref:YbjQ family protein n=1 Tax=Terasakiispira papahanaumokuakeensis TaxID=197479 RepID=UPI001111C718|nr:heavy metal-binding domain-containing protein [Terasakiispira papahanaumokuakeensis]